MPSVIPQCYPTKPNILETDIDGNFSSKKKKNKNKEKLPELNYTAPKFSPTPLRFWNNTPDTKILNS